MTETPELKVVFFPMDASKEQGEQTIECTTCGPLGLCQYSERGEIAAAHFKEVHNATVERIDSVVRDVPLGD